MLAIYFPGFPGSSPPNLGRRVSNSMEPHGNVSFHRLGMVSHKMSLITIFGHKHEIKNFIKKFDTFHEKFLILMQKYFKID